MSSKIDGVPRELLEDMLNPYADFATHDRLRALLAAPVVERQPFFYGIMQPDGKPHYSELCVSGEASDLESEVESMNEDGDGGYRVVALYASQPAPVSVVLDEGVEFEKWWCHTPVLRKGKLQIAQEAWEARACLDKIKELNK